MVSSIPSHIKVEDVTPEPDEAEMRRRENRVQDFNKRVDFEFKRKNKALEVMDNLKTVKEVLEEKNKNNENKDEIK